MAISLIDIQTLTDGEWYYVRQVERLIDPMLTRAFRYRLTPETQVVVSFGEILKVTNCDLRAEPAVRETVKRRLEQMGWQVSEADYDFIIEKAKEPVPAHPR